MNYVESNALLKLKFRNLHQTLVKKVEVRGSIVHFLFQERVIGSGDLKVLKDIEEYPGRQCKDLLARHIDSVVDLIDSCNTGIVLSCSTGIVLMYTFQRTTTWGLDRKWLGVLTPKICKYVGGVRVCFDP